MIDVLIPGLTAFLGSTAGVLVGWRIQRGRERREMRLPVYMAWLKTARTLVGPPSNAPLSGVITFPTPEMKARLNELTTELELVGSYRVNLAANTYLWRIQDPELARAMQAPGVRTMDDLIARFQAEMKDARTDVVRGMRRDLATRQLFARTPDPEAEG